MQPVNLRNLVELYWAYILLCHKDQNVLRKICVLVELGSKPLKILQTVSNLTGSTRDLTDRFKSYQAS